MQGKFGWTFTNSNRTEDKFGLESFEIEYVLRTGEPMCVVDERVWSRDFLRDRYFDATQTNRRFGHENWGEAYTYVLRGEAFFATAEQLRTANITPKDAEEGNA